VGGGWALAALLGLTSRSKGRAARWRFGSLVFFKVRRLRLAFVSGAPLSMPNRTGNLDIIGALELPCILYS